MHISNKLIKILYFKFYTAQLIKCLTLWPLCSTEEEEEEEIVQPQPVVETPTEKPDQKEEEEGNSPSAMQYNWDVVMKVTHLLQIHVQ